MLTADRLIALLGLRPLSLEGGYFRETYRCADALPAAALPRRYGREKAMSTAIYYLLTADTFSALHRLPTDEVFHFYLGDPVEMLQLLPDGTGRLVALGPDLLAGQAPQVVVPGGAWQGSRLRDGGRLEIVERVAVTGFLGGHVTRPDDYVAEAQLTAAGFKPVRLLAEKAGVRFVEGLKGA